MQIATSAQMRQVDQETIQTFGIPSLVLMERAGMAVFESCKDLLPNGGRITFVCGKGNNGGDALVAARHAHEEGYDVQCFMLGQVQELSADTLSQFKIVQALGIQTPLLDLKNLNQYLDEMVQADLLVDGIFGTGIKQGDPGQLIARLIQRMNQSGIPILAIDIPSGIHADTGQAVFESVQATETITLALPKPFLFQREGLEASGSWSIADIGIPNVLLEQSTQARTLEAEDVQAMLRPRHIDAQKRDSGHVLIVAGSAKMPGAAVLAAMGAIHSGAGLTTVASVPSVCQHIASLLPEVMLLPLPEIDGVISPEAAEVLLGWQKGGQKSAVFGPGLSHSEPVLEMLSSLWTSWTIPSCIDADALNAFSSGVSLPKAECILTPHAGEMGRLMDSNPNSVQSDRFNTIRTAVGEYGKNIILKGAYSLHCDPLKNIDVNMTGNPGMAVGGMGDVLSGIVGAFLAQGYSCSEAACCAMFLHGLAGDICSKELGHVGYTATDLAYALPKARQFVDS